MASLLSSNSYFIISCALLISFSLCGSAVSAQLSSSFYSTSCPDALSIIESEITDAVCNETRVGASLLRLHFHDCFVNGCDASVLLDDTATFKGEKTAAPNNNSIRGFEVIDAIKSHLESACPRTVSCADILAVAARDSVVALGGPSWTVPLGRRDSTTASFSAASSDLPPPTLNLTELVSAFSKKGLSATDMVALSGAHTVGLSKCANFRDRIYKEANVDSSFAATTKSTCPSSGGDDNLAPLDVSTHTIFDNFYFKNLVGKKGLLHSDQVLFNNGSADSLVASYAANMAAFFSDFSSAMVKMGGIGTLTGTNGQVRTDCRKVN